MNSHREQLRMRKTVELSPGMIAAYGDALLRELLNTSLIRPRDWEALAADVKRSLAAHVSQDSLLKELVGLKLLTAFQAERLRSGAVFGLILGNYRVLDRLGAGGMGIVYKAEHMRLPRLVAIKVLPLAPDHDPRLLQRFFAEMWAVSQLYHPNIVGALDAGEAADPAVPGLRLHYFVMDYVAGESLEDMVRARGPLEVTTACDLAHQVAGALAEANKHGLVHRDIKPSNILVTPEGQAKLLDFGLARHEDSLRLTDPGTVLGTLDYVAPEQAQDARGVDIRADIYGLGATLFWCLTGRPPFAIEGNAVRQLLVRLQQGPPSPRAVRSDLPAELDAVVARMMSVQPDDRYPTPKAVMQALLPFLGGMRIEDRGLGEEASSLDLRSGVLHPRQRIHHVLIVDDDQAIRDVCRYTLQSDGIRCDEAESGALALEAFRGRCYDLVLSDIDMPEMTGPQLLKRLRAEPPCPNLKVIMFSGRASGDEMAQMLLSGADDYLTKPVSIMQVLFRVKALLRLKDAQDRSDLLNRHLSAANAELERNLTNRDSDLVEARNALVLALAELVCQRDIETGAHLRRMQRYCRTLAEEAAASGAFAGQFDESAIALLECCAPLHDIGMVGVPDHVLRKPGRLDAAERIIMQTHTTLGAQTLERVAGRHGFAAAFLRTAVDVVRFHHERYDGRGYPDRLAGDSIPLVARIVAIADVYDALRNRRPHKPPLSHAAAIQVMTEASPGQFDPRLMDAFHGCADQFERIAREVPD